jgi:signal transduction histidine kinase
VGEWHGDVNNIRKDGMSFWCNANVSTFSHPKHGKVLISIHTDITERKRAEELIKKEVDQLQELDKIKNEFVIRASHELRTPLISIFSASNIILDIYKDRLDPKTLEFIELIQKGGERLHKLVSDLTEILKIKSKKVELNLEEVNLSQLIHESVSNLQLFALEKYILINVMVEKEVYISIDKSRIRQVIEELLLNAIKNTPPDGMISINLQQHPNYVNLLMKDNGVGFTEEEKSKTFKKFGKIERYGQGRDIITEGIGLGLYISKKNIELHQGKIRLESDGKDLGSSIIITLPRNIKEN